MLWLLHTFGNIRLPPETPLKIFQVLDNVLVVLYFKCNFLSRKQVLVNCVNQNWLVRGLSRNRVNTLMDGAEGQVSEQEQGGVHGESNNYRKHIRLEKKHGVGLGHNLVYFISTLTIWVFLGKSQGLSVPQFPNKVKVFDQIIYGSF